MFGLKIVFSMISGTSAQLGGHRSWGALAGQKTKSRKISEKSILAFILACRNVSKSFEIAPKNDAERSLFRDAMQLAKKSSEVNGSRRL